MDRITINGSTSYDVVIEQNILNNVGTLLRKELGGNKALIISDSNVAPIYLDKISSSLKDYCYDTLSCVLPAGEKIKNIDNYVSILEFLSTNEFASSDLVIALGGGSVGDLAGFAAATYKRGTKFVQIPTTLLACVDSSVGGKSAINLPTGKNQVGVIRNPSIVICDPESLHSLPADILADGYSEIIKYGVLQGREIIDLFVDAVSSGDFSSIIFKAIEVKRIYIEEDESDSNSRQFLNLGHLIGHAIEAASNYSISHGKAVAFGLILESKIFQSLALASNFHLSSAIANLVHTFGLDFTNAFTWGELMPYILRDKRIRNNEIDIIVASDFGNCTLHKLSVSELQAFLLNGSPTILR